MSHHLNRNTTLTINNNNNNNNNRDNSNNIQIQPKGPSLSLKEFSYYDKINGLVFSSVNNGINSAVDILIDSIDRFSFGEKDEEKGKSSEGKKESFRSFESVGNLGELELEEEKSKLNSITEITLPQINAPASKTPNLLSRNDRKTTLNFNDFFNENFDLSSKEQKKSRLFLSFDKKYINPLVKIIKKEKKSSEICGFNKEKTVENDRKNDDFYGNKMAISGNLEENLKKNKEKGEKKGKESDKNEEGKDVILFGEMSEEQEKIRKMREDLSHREDDVSDVKINELKDREVNVLNFINEDNKINNISEIGEKDGEKSRENNTKDNIKNITDIEDNCESEMKGSNYNSIKFIDNNSERNSETKEEKYGGNDVKLKYDENNNENNGENTQKLKQEIDRNGRTNEGNKQNISGELSENIKKLKKEILSNIQNKVTNSLGASLDNDILDLPIRKDIIINLLSSKTKTDVFDSGVKRDKIEIYSEKIRKIEPKFIEKETGNKGRFCAVDNDKSVNESERGSNEKKNAKDLVEKSDDKDNDVGLNKSAIDISPLPNLLQKSDSRNSQQTIQNNAADPSNSLSEDSLYHKKKVCSPKKKSTEEIEKLRRKLDETEFECKKAKDTNQNLINFIYKMFGVKDLVEAELESGMVKNCMRKEKGEEGKGVNVPNQRLSIISKQTEEAAQEKVKFPKSSKNSRIGTPKKTILQGKYLSPSLVNTEYIYAKKSMVNNVCQNKEQKFISEIRTQNITINPDDNCNLIYNSPSVMSSNPTSKSTQLQILNTKMTSNNKYINLLQPKKKTYAQLHLKESAKKNSNKSVKYKSLSNLNVNNLNSGASYYSKKYNNGNSNSSNLLTSRELSTINITDDSYGYRRNIRQKSSGLMKKNPSYIRNLSGKRAMLALNSNITNINNNIYPKELNITTNNDINLNSPYLGIGLNYPGYNSKLSFNNNKSNCLSQVNNNIHFYSPSSEQINLANYQRQLLSTSTNVNNLNTKEPLFYESGLDTGITIANNIKNNLSNLSGAKGRGINDTYENGYKVNSTDYFNANTAGTNSNTYGGVNNLNTFSMDNLSPDTEESGVKIYSHIDNEDCWVNNNLSTNSSKQLIKVSSKQNLNVPLNTQNKFQHSKISSKIEPRSHRMLSLEDFEGIYDTKKKTQNKQLNIKVKNNSNIGVVFDKKNLILTRKGSAHGKKLKKNSSKNLNVSSSKK